jgi:hypothetical protein
MFETHRSSLIFFILFMNAKTRWPSILLSQNFAVFGRCVSKGVLFLVSDDFTKTAIINATELWQPDLQLLNSFGAGFSKVATRDIFSP